MDFSWLESILSPLKVSFPFFVFISVLVLLALGFVLGKLSQKLAFSKQIKDERKDAVKRSRAVLGGQFAEQLAPFFPDFPCNPADCQFLGKPVDFIAFPGSADGSEISDIVFIEVKKTNNVGGMVAEANRMTLDRFPNKKFRRVLNITQLMMFSNNMEYDALGGIVPIQGAFYCTGARSFAPFNCFREENPGSMAVAPYNRDYPYLEINKDIEKIILKKPC